MFFHIQIGFILLIIITSAVGQYCSGSTYCSEGRYYWCCPSSQQCGMNLGTCYSKQAMDKILIIGGAIGGTLLLCCFAGIFWAIRQSHVNQARAERARNHFSLPVTYPTVITQSTPPPPPYSNPLPMGLTSPVNMINSIGSVSQETPNRKQSTAYNDCMKYLTKTDELLHKDQANNQSTV